MREREVLEKRVLYPYRSIKKKGLPSVLKVIKLIYTTKKGI
jgi:hypothetical protein